jgi:hypothetical protein
VLVIARFVQGIGGGGLYVFSPSTVAKIYPERIRPRVMALLASMWIFPGCLGCRSARARRDRRLAMGGGSASSAASSISSSDFPALPFNRMRNAASTASCRSDNPCATLISVSASSALARRPSSSTGTVCHGGSDGARTRSLRALLFGEVLTHSR